MSGLWSWDGGAQDGSSGDHLAARGALLREDAGARVSTPGTRQAARCRPTLSVPRGLLTDHGLIPPPGTRQGQVLGEHVHETETCARAALSPLTGPSASRGRSLRRSAWSGGWAVRVAPALVGSASLQPRPRPPEPWARVGSDAVPRGHGACRFVSPCLARSPRYGRRTSSQKGGGHLSCRYPPS